MACHWKSSCRVLALIVAGTFGCSSAYLPRPSHRISFIESEGGVKLTRDSQDFTSWNVDQAVAGNPQAESEARTFLHRTTAGLVLDGVGLALIAAGAPLAAQSESSARRDVGGGLIAGGCVSIVVAFVLLATGLPHIYDAINIYNDGLPPDSNR
jgi:hypothetical protein